MWVILNLDEEEIT